MTHRRPSRADVAHHFEEKTEDEDEPGPLQPPPLAAASTADSGTAAAAASEDGWHTIHRGVVYPGGSGGGGAGKALKTGETRVGSAAVGRTASTLAGLAALAVAGLELREGLVKPLPPARQRCVWPRRMVAVAANTLCGRRLVGSFYHATALKNCFDPWAKQPLVYALNSIDQLLQFAPFRLSLRGKAAYTVSSSGGGQYQHRDDAL